MWLRTSCLLEFNAAVDTPFLFMLRPRSGWHQWISREEYVLTPSVTAVEFTDPFGNLCQRVVAPAGPFTIHVSSDIECSDESDVATGAPFVEVHRLPDATLPFLLPSRYCESDRFVQMAPSIVNGCAAGYDQCQAIVEYIRNTIPYLPGSGQDIISACEVNGRNGAVCRDMAHFGIALCRALSIPARMVVGYLEGLQPMDLHAWFEAYVGGAVVYLRSNAREPYRRACCRGLWSRRGGCSHLHAVWRSSAAGKDGSAGRTARAASHESARGVRAAGRHAARELANNDQRA